MNTSHIPQAFIRRLRLGHRQYIDQGFLTYLGTTMALAQLNYAVVVSLLRPEGLASAHVTEVWGQMAGSRASALQGKTVSAGAVANVLTNLRDTLPKYFGDQLTLPRVAAGGQHARTAGLALWTKGDIDLLRAQMRNPGPGVRCVMDERGLWRLYLDGHEIKPGKGASKLDCDILKLASTESGFHQNKLDVTVARVTVQQSLVNLRRALERTVGKTLTYSNADRAAESTPVRLVDAASTSTNARFAADPS